MDKSTVIDEGVAALAKGWELIALKGKLPFHDRRRKGWDMSRIGSEQQLHQFAHQGANLGLLCRPSGLVVLDVDPRNGGLPRNDYAPTLSTSTGQGGQHFLYTNPGVQLRGRDGQGVDVKDNGYVVLPPGFEGAQYRWTNNLPVADLPSIVLDRLAKPTREPRAGDIEQYADTPIAVGPLWWQGKPTDRSRRDFRLAWELIRSGQDLGTFERCLLSLPAPWDKGRNRPEYYGETWDAAIEHASDSYPPTKHTHVSDTSNISFLTQLLVRHDARHTKTDTRVADWFLQKSSILGRQVFRAAISEIAKDLGVHRHTISSSLDRLQQDGLIVCMAPHTFDLAAGSGKPRSYDVSALLSRNPAAIRPALNVRGYDSPATLQGIRTWTPKTSRSSSVT